MTCYDSCCRNYEDDGPVVVEISETVRKSKVQRECAWCHIEIKPGMRYRRFVNKLDDEIVVTVGCLDARNCQWYGGGMDD